MIIFQIMSTTKSMLLLIRDKLSYSFSFVATCSVAKAESFYVINDSKAKIKLATFMKEVKRRKSIYLLQKLSKTIYAQSYFKRNSRMLVVTSN